MTDHLRRVQHHYDHHAREYDTRWSAYITTTRDAALRRLPLKPRMRILDAGCGTGRTLHAILAREPTVHAVGVDISPRMIAKARATLKHKKNARLISGDLTALPFPKNHFDAILALNNFHYLRDPERALTEFRRALKPNGTLILLDWSRDTLMFKLAHVYWTLFNPAYVRCYTTREIHHLLHQQGFAVTHTEHVRAGRFWRVFLITARKN